MSRDQVFLLEGPVAFPKTYFALFINDASDDNLGSFRKLVLQHPPGHAQMYVDCLAPVLPEIEA